MKLAALKNDVTSMRGATLKLVQCTFQTLVLLPYVLYTFVSHFVCLSLKVSHIDSAVFVSNLTELFVARILQICLLE